MRINNNLMAMNTQRQLGMTVTNTSKSMEKLSSGFRINRAGDDAAGLAISEKMRSQIRGLVQASRNSQDGISLIQTAEGALAETHSMLQRMRELVTQANNGTNQVEDREKIQTEIEQLQTEITNIATKTQFNKQNLLNGDLGAKTESLGSDLLTGSGALKIVDVTGAKVDAVNVYQVTGAAKSLTVSFTDADGNVLSQTIGITDATSVAVGTKFNFDKLGITLESQLANISTVGGTAANGQFNVTASGISLQTGANATDQMSVSVGAMDASTLGVNTIDVSTESYSTFATDIAALDDAITTVSGERAKMGAWQNRLEHTIANLDTSAENLTAAESRIRDVDMAKEMMNLTKNNILQQAATAMLAQANQAPQSVLQLLQ